MDLRGRARPSVVAAFAKRGLYSANDLERMFALPRGRIFEWSRGRRFTAADLRPVRRGRFTFYSKRAVALAVELAGNSR